MLMSGEARVGIIKIQRKMRDIILSRNQQELNDEIHKVKQIDESIISNLDIIKNSTIVSESIELEKEVRKLFLEWQSGREEIIKLVQSGNTNEAICLTKDEFSATVDKLKYAMDKGIQYNLLPCQYASQRYGRKTPQAQNGWTMQDIRF